MDDNRIKMTKLGSGIGEADRLDPDQFYSIKYHKRGRGGFSNCIKGSELIGPAGCFIEDDKQDNRHLVENFKWSPTKKYNRYRTNVNSPKG